MVKKIWVILVLVFITSLSHVEAATIKLEKNTEMHPQGWIAGAILLKAGTEVTLNDNGEVISGTLKYYSCLKPAAQSYFVNNNQDLQDTICLKGDTIVSFNEQGEVMFGTLGDDVSIMVAKNKQYVSFKALTPITFNSVGGVAVGTIKYDMSFRPAGWENSSKENAGFIMYKAGTELTFNTKGEVIASKPKVNN